MCTRRGGAAALSTGSAAIAAATERAALAAVDAAPATSMEEEWRTWSNDPASEQMVNPLTGLRRLDDAASDQWWDQSAELYDLGMRLDEIFPGTAGPPTQTVSLAGLGSMQPSVKRDGVRRYIETIAQTGSVPRSTGGAGGGSVVVFRIGGKDYVYDGNHRATAAKLLGLTSVKAQVYDFDKHLGKLDAAHRARLRAAGLL